MNGDVFIPSTNATVQDFLQVSFCKSGSVTYILPIYSSYFEACVKYFTYTFLFLHEKHMEMKSRFQKCSHLTNM